MIQAILFDLDNCLSPADAPGRELLDPVIAAIRQTGGSAFAGEAMEAVEADLWRHPLDFIAQKHDFPPDVLDAARAAYAELEIIGTMPGYPDLGLLGDLPAERFLVTSGFRRLQESKVRALGIGPLFASVVIDAIDEPDRRGKERIFAGILADRNLPPAEALVVGDNPDSEIAAGNRLGIPTVQTCRPGVSRHPSATHHVHGLRDLAALLRRLNA